MDLVPIEKGAAARIEETTTAPCHLAACITAQPANLQGCMQPKPYRVAGYQADAPDNATCTLSLVLGGRQINIRNVKAC
jgi:hypothetical protein